MSCVNNKGEKNMQSTISLEEYILIDNVPKMTQKAFKIFVGQKASTEKKLASEWKNMYSLMMGKKTNIK